MSIPIITPNITPEERVLMIRSLQCEMETILQITRNEWKLFLKNNHHTGQSCKISSRLTFDAIWTFKYLHESNSRYEHGLVEQSKKFEEDLKNRLEFRETLRTILNKLHKRIPLDYIDYIYIYSALTSFVKEMSNFRKNHPKIHYTHTDTKKIDNLLWKLLYEESKIVEQSIIQ